MASRTSPPTDRVVAVLDHLVAHGGQTFGLSELARSLAMSKPTCLGILSSLVDGGYLVRTRTPVAYGLGPALIAAGRAAQDAFAVGPQMEQQLEVLSAEFGTTCTASQVVGDRITLLAVTGADSRKTARVGQSYPFAPPVGLMYVLWDSDERVEEWLRREPALPVRLDRAHLRRVVEQCRGTGYLVETLTDVGRRLHSVMAGVAVHELSDEVRELLGEVVSSLGDRVYLGESAPGEAHGVSLIAAPTYDARGRQSMVLTLHVGMQIDSDGIIERGRALKRVADDITTASGGRRPAR